MVEESKGASSPPAQSTDEEKKQQPAPTPAASPQQISTAAQPQRPPVSPQQPRPAAPIPPQRPAAPRNEGRRTFAKAIVAIAAVLSIIPFVPWGSYLSSSVSSTGAYKRQKVVLDLNTPANRNANGGAAGMSVNVNDLTTFPANSTYLLTYPSSGDVTVDSQNPDTFSKFGLIRLPEELGGSEKSATAFVAFSKVCVHLWCSPNYDPSKSTNPSDETYQCPCHGSIYRVPDGLSIAGPASLQPPPTNAIPMLTLTADSDGTLYIEAPLWDVDHNGVIGYGRNYASYDTYIKPKAEGGSS